MKHLRKLGLVVGLFLGLVVLGDGAFAGVRVSPVIVEEKAVKAGDILTVSLTNTSPVPQEVKLSWGTFSHAQGDGVVIDESIEARREVEKVFFLPCDTYILPPQGTETIELQVHNDGFSTFFPVMFVQLNGGGSVRSRVAVLFFLQTVQVRVTGIGLTETESLVIQ